MRDYPERSLALVDGLASELDIHLFPNLRLRNATDGSIALAGGYECASLASVHRPQAAGELPLAQRRSGERRLRLSVADAVRLIEAVVRRLDERWLD